LSIPILLMSNFCGGKVPNGCDDFQPKTEKKKGDKVIYACLACDTLASLTSLIIGILGAVSIIAMPAAVAYTLVAISGSITALYIAMIIKAKCDSQPRPQPV